MIMKSIAVAAVALPLALASFSHDLHSRELHEDGLNSAAYLERRDLWDAADGGDALLARDLATDEAAMMALQRRQLGKVLKGAGSLAKTLSKSGSKASGSLAKTFSKYGSKGSGSSFKTALSHSGSLSKTHGSKSFSHSGSLPHTNSQIGQSFSHKNSLHDSLGSGNSFKGFKYEHPHPETDPFNMDNHHDHHATAGQGQLGKRKRDKFGEAASGFLRHEGVQNVAGDLTRSFGGAVAQGAASRMQAGSQTASTRGQNKENIRFQKELIKLEIKRRKQNLPPLDLRRTNSAPAQFGGGSNNLDSGDDYAPGGGYPV